MEVLESKRTTTCSAGTRKRQCTVGHIAQGGLGLAKRGQAKDERTRVTNRLANVSPPVAALSSLVLCRDGAKGCCSCGERPPTRSAAATGAHTDELRSDEAIAPPDSITA